MVSFNLTPAEVASLVASHNHPGPLSADELERLVSHLTDAQMDEFVELLGLGELARQLPPVLLKVMKAVQRLVRENPPEYDDEINAIIRDLDLTTLGAYNTGAFVIRLCFSFPGRIPHPASVFA
jgi:hypothetical protein